MIILAYGILAVIALLAFYPGIKILMLVWRNAREKARKEIGTLGVCNHKYETHLDDGWYKYKECSLCHRRICDSIYQASTRSITQIEWLNGGKFR